MKEKLVQLFTDHIAQKVLSENEIRAVLEYLQKHVKPFATNLIKRDLLNVLIRKSEIVDIESDQTIFSHNISQMEDQFGIKMSRMNDQQYLYNQSKKIRGGDQTKVQMINNKKIDEKDEIQEDSEYSPKKLKNEVDQQQFGSDNLNTIK